MAQGITPKEFKPFDAYLRTNDSFGFILTRVEDLRMNTGLSIHSVMLSYDNQWHFCNEIYPLTNGKNKEIIETILKLQGELISYQPSIKSVTYEFENI